MTALDRQDAKSLSLGTLYGMRYKKFGRMTGKSNSEARETFGQFNERLPFMHETFEAAQTEAETMGFVRTIGGRVCHLTESIAYRALNRKLQGSCADWIKKSMLDAYRAGIFSEIELYLTVHDELDSGVPPTAAGAEASHELVRIMCGAYPLSVPVLAGVDIGKSWGELVEYGEQQPLLDLLMREKR
jgi:DNA polymerase-1